MNLIHQNPTMNVELIVTVINILISFGFLAGVYKNKIDTLNKLTDKFQDIEIKLARLEEKINSIVNEKHF
jgi:division protein CdvB (Snf7/Vps24/ESCRT-III family)